jgi:hypothetical protein
MLGESTFLFAPFLFRFPERVAFGISQWLRAEGQRTIG